MTVALMGLGVEDPREQRFFCGQIGHREVRKVREGAKGTDP